MILYHGTISTCAENIINRGINLSKGNKRVDFGQGFYTTPSIKFARSTALNKSFKTNSHYDYEFCKPIIISFAYEENTSLNILKFKDKGLNWAQFIINNRNGFQYVKNTKQKFHNLNRYFDIVIGEIADSNITAIAQELLILNETLSAQEICDIVYQYKTCQYSFHTEKSLSCIKIVGCDIIETGNKGGVVNE